MLTFSKQMKAYSSILVTALLWSIIGVLSKVCLQEGLHPFQCAFFRSLFGFLAFFIHCLVTHQLKISFKHCCWLMFFGVWGIGIYYSCAQITILLAGASMDIILQYTAPFWVAIFARIFFGEVLTFNNLIAIFLACLGTLAVCVSGGSLKTNAPLIAIVTGLVSGLCYASHYPFTRFWQKRYSSAVIFTWMLAGGSIALFVICIFTDNFRFDFKTNAYVSLAIIGIACTYLAFLTYGYALQRLRLVPAVICTQLEPVLSMFWVWLYFDECFSPIGWTGSFLILFSILLLVLHQDTKSLSKSS